MKESVPLLKKENLISRIRKRPFSKNREQEKKTRFPASLVPSLQAGLNLTEILLTCGIT